jgi:hypothetical protein
MRRGDDPRVYQRFHTRRGAAIEKTLHLVSVPPVLLSLTANARLPPPTLALGTQAQTD